MKRIAVSCIVIICFLQVNVWAFSAKMVADKSPKEIIDAYIKAVGGLEKINGIKNMMIVMEANLQGMTLEISSTSDQENKRLMQQTAMNGNVVQKTVVKNGKGYIYAMGEQQELREDQLDAVNAQIFVFPEIQYESLGYTLTAGDIQDIDGEAAYTLNIVTSKGIETTEYYSISSGLKLRTSTEQAGDITYGDYEEVDGIMIPTRMTISNAMLPMPIEARMVKVKFNETLDSSLFD
ncbi:peptidase, M16 family protein [Aquiflexum sp.]|uniref:peptidase, M16 family protein n=1 Tax=Aquiflexum sp. TaxID=1872584 RepID=UPI003593EB6A